MSEHETGESHFMTYTPALSSWAASFRRWLVRCHTSDPRIHHTRRRGSFRGVMANAFANTPRFRFLLPNDAQRKAKLRWYWGAVIRAGLHSSGVIHVAREEPNGLPLGVAIWEPSGHSKHSAFTLLRSGFWAASIRLGVSACLRRRSLSSALATLVPPGHCWYLDAIGVDPSQQRSGLGTALLRWMLARVDSDGLPAFLDTSAPDNLGYYERFGFEVTVEATLILS